MAVYYNENDHEKAAWLRELIAGHRGQGEVDERSITEISPDDLPDSRNAISSPESESGAMPCDSPDGPTTDLFGQEVAPAPAFSGRKRRRV